MTTKILDVWNENALSVQKTVIRMTETRDFHLISASELRAMFTLFRTVMQDDNRAVDSIRMETRAFCAAIHPKLTALQSRFMDNNTIIQDATRKAPGNYKRVVNEFTSSLFYGMAQLFSNFPSTTTDRIVHYSTHVNPWWESIHKNLEKYLPYNRPQESIIWKDVVDKKMSKEIMDAWVAHAQDVTSGVLLGIALYYACQSARDHGEFKEHNEKARFENVMDMIETCKRIKRSVTLLEEEFYEVYNTAIVQDVLADYSEKTDVSMAVVVKKLQEKTPDLNLIVLRYKPLENHRGFTSKSITVNGSKYYSANGSKYSYIAFRTDYLKVKLDKDGKPLESPTRQGDLDLLDSYQRDTDLDCSDVLERLKLITMKPYSVFVLEYRPAYDKWPVPNRGDAHKLEFECSGTTSGLHSYKSMECFHEKNIKGFPSTYKFITTKHVVISNTVL